MGNGAKIVLVIGLLAVVIVIVREIKKDVAGPDDGSRRAKSGSVAKADPLKRQPSTSNAKSSRNGRPRAIKPPKDDENFTKPVDAKPAKNPPSLVESEIGNPYPVGPTYSDDRDDESSPNVVTVLPRNGEDRSAPNATGANDGRNGQPVDLTGGSRPVKSNFDSGGRDRSVDRNAVFREPSSSESGTSVAEGVDDRQRNGSPSTGSPSTGTSSTGTSAVQTPTPVVENEPVGRDSAVVRAGYPKSHVIVEGDTIWDLAKQYYGQGGHFVLILEANGLSEDSTLKLGQKIEIPAPPARNKVATRAPTPKKKDRRYVVREGDSLYSIAEAKLGSGNRWTEIAALNPDLNPDRLSIGARLELPKP